MSDDYWRSRIVETITVDHALAARDERSFQVAPVVEAVKEEYWAWPSVKFWTALHL